MRATNKKNTFMLGASLLACAFSISSARADMTYVMSMKQLLGQLQQSECKDEGQQLCDKKQDVAQAKQQADSSTDPYTKPMLQARYESMKNTCIQKTTAAKKECDKKKDAAAVAINKIMDQIQATDVKGQAGIEGATAAAAGTQEDLAEAKGKASGIAAKAKEMASQLGSTALQQAGQTKEALLATEMEHEERVKTKDPVKVLTAIEKLGQQQLAKDMAAAKQNIANAQQAMGLMKQLASMMQDKGGAKGGSAGGASKAPPPPSTVAFKDAAAGTNGFKIGPIADAKSIAAGLAGSGNFGTSGASRAPGSTAAGRKSSGGGLGGSSFGVTTASGGGSAGGGGGAGGAAGKAVASGMSRSDAQKSGVAASMSFDGGISGGTRTAMLGLRPDSKGFAMPKTNFGNTPLPENNTGEILPENEAERNLASTEGGVNDDNVSLFNVTRLKLQEYKSKGLLF